MNNLRKNWVIFTIGWIVFTIIGELLAFGPKLLPGKYSDTAHVVDEAYILLIAMAVPVFAAVVSVLVTCMLRFAMWKSSDVPPAEDGPHLANNKPFVLGWTAVTAVLAVVLAVNPGFVGLRKLRGESRADLVVKVQAQRWSWRFTYPDGRVATDALELPVDERVRFDLTSIDIVHSFWIPAFRIKLDTVPGRVTTLYLTPDKTGTYEDDFNLRVQCAELCGRDHAIMAVPVRIVERSEFDAWTKSLNQEA